MTSSPVDAVGPSGPVGRSVGEIRADLAHCDRDGVPWPEAARRLLADVPGLLAEVEAAHRFEQAAGVEVAELVESLERVTEERDAFRDERNIAVNAAASKIPGFDVETIAVQVRQREAADSRARELRAEVRSLRGVVQAVAELADEWERKAGPESSAWAAFGPQKVSVPFAVMEIRAAVAAAADAPQTEDGCAECTEAGTKNCTAGCCRAGQR